MSIRKRIVAMLFAIIAAASVMMGGVFCSADDPFGTVEEGIYQIGKRYWIQRHPAYKGGDGLPNGDFEQGYKYWAQNFGQKCSDVTTLMKEENGNTYLHFDGEKQKKNWDGITSVRFTVKGVEPGSPVALLYKWRGDTQFQVYLEQWDMSEDEQRGNMSRVSVSGYTKIIYEAYEEGEWNIGVTSAADGTKAVIKPTQGSDEIFFMIGIQTATDPTAVFDIDDVQLVYRQNDGIVKNLKGEKLYDLNNLEMKVVEETDVDLSDFDFDSKKVEMPGPSGMTASTNVVISESNNVISNIAKSVINPASPWFWVVVSAGVVIIIAAAVVIILLIKKKKSSVEEADEVSENTEEAEEVSDEISEETE